MAADTRASGDDTAVNVTKIYQLPHGDIAGGAGLLGVATAAIQWLQGNRKGPAPDIEGADILFTDAGVPYYASGSWPGSPVRGPIAIGSGAQGAMVALKLGKTPEEAVKLMFDIDPSTGGQVDVLRYKKPRSK